MSNPIEELRAQRELIQKHLNWLDAQIQKAGNEDTHSPPNLAGISSETSTQKNNLLEQTVGKTVQSNVEANPDTLAETRLMQPTSASDIQRVQMGCFVFFAAITLLFLFLLFGLPYLLD